MNKKEQAKNILMAICQNNTNFYNLLHNESPTNPITEKNYNGKNAYILVAARILNPTIMNTKYFATYKQYTKKLPVILKEKGLNHNVVIPKGIKPISIKTYIPGDKHKKDVVKWFQVIAASQIHCDGLKELYPEKANEKMLSLIKNIELFSILVKGSKDNSNCEYNITELYSKLYHRIKKILITLDIHMFTKKFLTSITIKRIISRITQITNDKSQELENMINIDHNIKMMKYKLDNNKYINITTDDTDDIDDYDNIVKDIIYNSDNIYNIVTNKFNKNQIESRYVSVLYIQKCLGIRSKDLFEKIIKNMFPLL